MSPLSLCSLLPCFILRQVLTCTESRFAAKVIIHQTLSVLEDIVENISGEATKSRQICYQSLQESVQVSLALFPAFIHQSGRHWWQAPWWRVPMSPRVTAGLCRAH